MHSEAATVGNKLLRCGDFQWQDLKDDNSRMAHEKIRTAKMKKNKTDRSLKCIEEDTRKVPIEFYDHTLAVVADEADFYQCFWTWRLYLLRQQTNQRIKSFGI